VPITDYKTVLYNIFFFGYVLSAVFRFRSNHSCLQGSITNEWEFFGIYL